MVVEKSGASSGKGVRKRLLTVQAIRDALVELDEARSNMDVVLRSLDMKRIVEIEFDGVGNAHRAAVALGSYSSSISGAITDPKCQKVFAPPDVVVPSKKRKA